MRNDRTTSPRPGISFLAPKIQDDNPLPPMDIAGFAGFAGSGPIDTPVLVEDFQFYLEIFGEEIPLAFDEARGEFQHSLLTPAVRNFFRNGGTRCWVVRIAKAASTARFCLPHLLVNGQDIQATALESRSQGIWTDKYLVNTVLRPTVLPDAQYVQGNFSLSLGIAAQAFLESGDLLLADFRIAGVQAFIPYADPNEVVNRRAQQSVEVALGSASTHWFKRLSAAPQNLADYQAELLLPENLPVDIERPPTFSVRLPADLDPSLLNPAEVSLVLTADSEDLSLTRKFLSSGTTLSLTDSVATRNSPLLFPIKTVQFVSLESPGSPDTEIHFLASGNAIYLPLKNSTTISAELGTDLQPVVSRLRFDIEVFQNDGLIASMKDLALVSSHSRYWGNLPSDKQIFGKRTTDFALAAEITSNPIEEDALMPRFPFAFSGPAATDSSTASASEPQIFLPLGMPIVENRAARKAVINPLRGGNDMDRQGLSSFDARLFLDNDLAVRSLQTLNAAAFQKRYVSQPEQLLSGIHALLEIEEISMIAVPDAVHRSWFTATYSLTDDGAFRLDKSPANLIPLLTAPEIIQLRIPDRQLEASWEAVTGASSYRIEISEQVDFRQLAATETTKDLSAQLELKVACQPFLWFRIRAEHNQQIGPWSATVRVGLTEAPFAGCELIGRVAPLLSIDRPPHNQTFLVLNWGVVMPGNSKVIRYEVQRSVSPGGATFISAETVYLDIDSEYREFFDDSRILWFRVRALYDGVPGPWSNTVTSGIRTEERTVLQPPEEYQYDHLISIHRALLRFCAARADVFAVLSAPFHYREAETITYKTALTGQEPASLPSPPMIQILPLNLGEVQALSYGAIYHPWVFSRNQESNSVTRGIGLRAGTPDAVICGQMAEQSRTRGAWIAPANQTFEGVFALEPNQGIVAETSFFAAQINHVEQNSGGFMTLSAQTLSPEPEWRQINVRRLFILLRRVLLKEGSDLAFEPNDGILRRSVQRRLEGLLGELHQLGAFAGTFASQAYQVRIDRTINRPADLEAGRLICEIKAAPSVPTEFIIVRLVQTLTGLNTEEARTSA